MIVFEVNFNILLAKLERDLAGEAGWWFWSGYLAGLMEFSGKKGEPEAAERDFSVSVDGVHLHMAGRAAGEKGKTTVEAIAIFDRVAQKRGRQLSAKTGQERDLRGIS